MTDKRATIIYNPMSGRPGRRAERVREMIGLLAGRGISADAQATTGPDDATRLAREAIAGGAEIIVSYGGDGTLNEVLQAVAGSQAALAVWPGGTANVVATDLCITNKLERIAGMIAAGKTKRVALGVARMSSEFGVRSSELSVQQSEFPSGSSSVHHQIPTSQFPALNSEPRTPNDRFFLMMAGIGLDASIARAVNKRLKRRTGEFAYWIAGINHLFQWKPEPFVIEVDGKPYESVFTVIGNGKGYGGGMCMTPGAKLEEACFEVYILPRMANNFSYLGSLSGCLRGKPEKTGAKIVQGSHIAANSAQETWVEVDGEVIGTLPMTFDAVPDALSLVVP